MDSINIRTFMISTLWEYCACNESWTRNTIISRITDNGGQDLNNYIGYFATSLAGHDKGLTYVITGVDNEYVYVTDGRLRQVDEPKKKKLKHIQLIKICDDTIKDKISRNIKLTNEDIKLAIKKYNNR